MKPVVGVIDLGVGNVASVVKSLEELGALPKPICERREFSPVNALVLPGVGSFGAAAAILDERRLRCDLLNRIEAGTPLLGICLGMQLLLDYSEEAAGARGLGMIPGEVVSLGALGPRIGWSGIEPRTTEDVATTSTWFSTSRHFFYFNHNFASKPTDAADVLLVTADSDSVPAMIERDNVTGVQFHPERSQRAGRHFLESWLLTKVLSVYA